MKHPCKTKWQQKWIGLSVVSPDIQRLADAAEAFCGRFYRNNTKKSLLVIVGNFGSGKTHTAKAIFRFCLAAAMSAYEAGHWGKGDGKIPSAIFISWPEAANAFAEKQFGIMEDAVETKLVILDDIGAETDQYKSGLSKDKLCQILSRREKRFTVITTNVAPENWTEMFDGRVDDRLCRNSVICDITKVKSFAKK